MPDYPYNLTNFSTSTDLLGVTRFANEVLGGWLGMLFLAGVFVVAFMSLKNYPAVDAFGAASFIVFVLSMMLAALTLIPFKVVILTTTMLCISLILLFRANK